MIGKKNQMKSTKILFTFLIVLLFLFMLQGAIFGAAFFFFVFRLACVAGLIVFFAYIGYKIKNRLN
jgi:flagellar basal body-associated protein FliL